MEELEEVVKELKAEAADREVMLDAANARQTKSDTKPLPLSLPTSFFI